MNTVIKKISTKKYLEMYGSTFHYIEDENYFIGLYPNQIDDFHSLSIVNGLVISEGNHIDYIADEIVAGLREKLTKKYKTIKPSDIKCKLKLIIMIKNLPILKFDSQTKERLRNDRTEIKNFLKADLSVLINKAYKTPEIIDPITEVYKIKEEFAKRQELKKLEKPIKKIKSEKYLPAIKRKRYLVIAEGASAVGGISPVLGREECGYYELKGKPLNAWSQPQSKFTANKELSELYKIIQQEGYEQIVIASDQDLDGIHIRGLLIGFIQKYLPEFNDKFYLLQTPVIGLKKNGKLTKWYYDLEEAHTIDTKGYDSKYYKGLGSWLEKDLRHVITTDGISNMIQKVEFDDLEVINDWLGDDSDIRKNYISNNSFSIALL